MNLSGLNFSGSGNISGSDNTESIMKNIMAFFGNRYPWYQKSSFVVCGRFRGRMLPKRWTSRRKASTIGSLSFISMVGLSPPRTVSISVWSFCLISGWCIKYRRAHLSVKEVVSVPAAKKSLTDPASCSSGIRKCFHDLPRVYHLYTYVSFNAKGLICHIKLA